MRQLLFRRTYFKALMKLCPEHRLEAYDAIMLYAFEGEIADVADIVAPVLSVIIDCIEHDFERYEAAKLMGGLDG